MPKAPVSARPPSNTPLRLLDALHPRPADATADPVDRELVKLLQVRRVQLADRLAQRAVAEPDVPPAQPAVSELANLTAAMAQTARSYGELLKDAAHEERERRQEVESQQAQAVESAVRETEAKWDVLVRTLQQQHEKDLALLQQQHETALTALKEVNGVRLEQLEARIQQMEERYQAALQAARERHELELQKLKEQHQMEIELRDRDYRLQLWEERQKLAAPSPRDAYERAWYEAQAEIVRIDVDKARAAMAREQEQEHEEREQRRRAEARKDRLVAVLSKELAPTARTLLGQMMGPPRGVARHGLSAMPPRTRPAMAPAPDATA